MLEVIAQRFTHALKPLLQRDLQPGPSTSNAPRSVNASAVFDDVGQVIDPLVEVPAIKAAKALVEGQIV
jgi:hypothetical protein